MSAQQVQFMEADEVPRIFGKSCCNEVVVAVPVEDGSVRFNLIQTIVAGGLDVITGHDASGPWISRVPNKRMVLVVKI